MGSLTFQDLSGLDKKQSALYPVSSLLMCGARNGLHLLTRALAVQCQPITRAPRLEAPTEAQLDAARLQEGLRKRGRASPYYPIAVAKKVQGE